MAAYHGVNEGTVGENDAAKSFPDALVLRLTHREDRETGGRQTG